MEKQVLIYENVKKCPEIFSNVEIKAMLKQINISRDYLKNAWGEWMKARDKAILMTIYILALRPNEACSERCYLDYEECHRTDKKKCFKCKRTYKNTVISRFHCPYCDKYFCEKHRLPEIHKCAGNPTLPNSMKQIFESWTFIKRQ